MISLKELYFLFVKIGAILLGGGYVILPIILAEFTQKRNLLKHSDVIDYFALAQSLPGIIAANISMFIGYKLKGKLGAVVAMFGIITVPSSAAQSCADQLIDAGIRAIWNFAPIQLTVPKGIIVQNIDLAQSLAILSHSISNYSKPSPDAKA